jgi:chromosome segregation ATPase
VTDSDRTIRILQGIREDLQQSNRENATRFEQLTMTMNERFERIDKRFEHVNQRFEVVEGVLREMSEQMVLQSRGIKVAIEARANIEKRVDDHERRIAELEQREH